MSREPREETPTNTASTQTTLSPKQVALTPHTQAKVDSFLVRAYPGAYPEKEEAVKLTNDYVKTREAASSQQAAQTRSSSPKQAASVTEKISNCMFTVFGGMPAYGMRLTQLDVNAPETKTDLRNFRPN